MLYIVHPELVEQLIVPAPERIVNPNFTAQYYCTGQAIWYDKENDNNPKCKEIPLFRLISDIAEFNERPLSIITTGEENSKKTKTTIRALPNNKTDVDVAILAIPFNGKLDPLEDSDDYIIHKGTMITSDAFSVSLKTNDRIKYKKVLYLIIEMINDEFVIKFTSHSKRNNPDNPNGDPLWNENCITITFAKDGITATYDHVILDTWEYSGGDKLIFKAAPPMIKTVKPQYNTRTFTKANAKSINKFYFETEAE